ncbi:helix-turn-helix transcriptional regulator [Streptomyces kaniharaensis]|uniref:Helix-turn-helix transcriptional regulator n=1 Tax=Streptomyces kaniharaensis TaxID=212423 RepID=A0A6N7KX90_9ACTN|nr:helix-turn-helix transcriptional regulator [Streptomyces kaniharaensis]
MANVLFRRARLALGLTQRQVAERVCTLVEAVTGRESPFDAGYVSRIERGLITWPHEHYRHALCLVLGAETASELGLIAKQVHHRDHPDEVSSSTRREVLAAALALLPPAPPLSRLRMGDVRAIAHRTSVLEHWDRTSGGRAVRDFALRELHAAVEFTEASTSPAVRGALLGAIARLANLTAWSSFDAGLYDEARPLFQLGLTAGREHGDTGPQVVADLRRATDAEHHPGPGTDDGHHPPGHRALPAGGAHRSAAGRLVLHHRGVVVLLAAGGLRRSGGVHSVASPVSDRRWRKCRWLSKMSRGSAPVRAMRISAVAATSQASLRTSSQVCELPFRGFIERAPMAASATSPVSSASLRACPSNSCS